MKTIFKNHTFDKDNRLKLLKLLTPLALLAVIGLSLMFARPADSSAQSLEKLNRFVQGSKAADEATLMFRKGRDLIEVREYGEAVEHFKRFLSENPRHKDTDAAIYWLAYSLTKIEKFAEADAQLDRLLRDYPKSNWKDDARSLRVQIAGQVRDTRTINNELDQENNELKMIALQSLFQADPDRAFALVQDILKSDSTANRKLKEAAMMLLGQHGGDKGFDTLMALARNNADPKLQKTAIFWLGQSGDKRAFDLLQELTGSSDQEVAKTALFSMAQDNDDRAKQILLNIARGGQSPNLRKEAIFWLAQRNDETVVDELLQLFSKEQDMEVKKHMLFALTQSSSPRAAARINEIARSEGNPELRKQAIFWLAQRSDEQTLQMLLGLYDSEKDNSVKESLIFGFGQSHSKVALNKLMQIAKSDPSVEMRKKAIFWLGQSKDPEAAKLIEEILK